MLSNDQTKEQFLEEIEEECEIQELYENKDFRLVGMPFYNEDIKKQEFREGFNEILGVS